jgi:hypothetical protein
MAGACRTRVALPAGEGVIAGPWRLPRNGHRLLGYRVR